MIDLHTHVLPGIDDGPSDTAGSLELLAAAQREGVTTVAATPHVRPDHPEVRPRELAGQVEALRRESSEVDVVAGGEVDLYWALEAPDEDLRLVSYGQRGTDLLVETPYGALPVSFEDLLFRLSARGYRLLLAHPERSPELQRDPGRLAGMVGRGTLVQVTASALAEPSRRSRSRRMAHAMVREGLAHVIASDAHGAAAPGRAGMRAGVEAAARLAGDGRARWMATDAPAAILAGERLPEPPAGRRRLSLLVGRRDLHS